MPLQQTSGNATADAYSGDGGAAAAANYIEDVFSTYIYTGTGAAQTITNNINLSGNGGLVWIKDRTNAYNHNLFDTARGATNLLHSNTTDVTVTDANSLTAFGTTGFTLGSGNTSGNQVNTNTDKFVSWAFRKQPKFFDIVTYTGTALNRTISHNLGSVPGCIIVKRTDGPYSWPVYHRSFLSATYELLLNSGGPAVTAPNTWNNTAPTSSVFSVGNDSSVNASGGTYVAYLFAHNAGGFGLTNTDNVISCGSFISSGGVDTISLGYEPQWVLLKNRDNFANWIIFDTMRGFSMATSTAVLRPNLADLEQSFAILGNPTATGFQLSAGATIAGDTHIYIAIRRGPMKVPTVGTSVFSPIAYSGQSTTLVTNAGFVPDLSWFSNRGGSYGRQSWDRLRGSSKYLDINSFNPEASSSPAVNFNIVQNGTSLLGNLSETNAPSATFIQWVFGRAPKFFDEVCYTGTGTNRTVNHNLTIAPEFLIVKDRTSSTFWYGWTPSIANTQAFLFNNSSEPFTSTTTWNSTSPTASVFSLGTNSDVNGFEDNYVAYLFATCPGVSKVGSYSGTGATQTIDCGFTGGARFVFIKRIDSTGNWFLWDTARGMVEGTDFYTITNSASADFNSNTVYTTGVGFQVVSTNIELNASGGTYLFLAIA